MSEDKDFIFIEDPYIYDGWCAKVNIHTKEIVWRDEWFTKRLDSTFKEGWEHRFRESNPEYQIIQHQND